MDFQIPRNPGKTEHVRTVCTNQALFFFFSTHAREPGNKARVNSTSMPSGVYVDFSLDSLKDTRLLATTIL